MVAPYTGNTPNRSTGAETFSVDTDYYHSWLATAIPTWNSDIAALTLNSTNDTSSSSVLIGVGSKSFTVSASKSYVKGMWLVLADTAAPSTNSMVGQVTSYAGTALVVDVQANGVKGSGTKTAWTISQTSMPIASSGYLQARDEKANNTAGGASVIGDQIRVLSTLVSNTIAGASLASNQLTLPAGTYIVRAHAPAYNVGAHQLRLQNVTDSAVVIRGTNEYTFSTVQTRSVVEGRFTLAATKVLNLTHYTNLAVATNGLGPVINIGAVENYASIEIWQE